MDNNRENALLILICFCNVITVTMIKIYVFRDDSIIVQLLFITNSDQFLLVWHNNNVKVTKRQDLNRGTASKLKGSCILAI